MDELEKMEEKFKSLLKQTRKLKVLFRLNVFLDLVRFEFIFYVCVLFDLSLRKKNQRKRECVLFVWNDKKHTHLGAVHKISTSFLFVKHLYNKTSLICTHSGRICEIGHVCVCEECAPGLVCCPICRNSGRAFKVFF
jgi:hypothetical protein